MQKHVAIKIPKHKFIKGVLATILFAWALFLSVVAQAIYGQLTVRAEAQNSIYISEFMASSNAVNDTDGEWIELFNPTGQAISLEGWSIEDSIGRSSTILDVTARAHDTVVLCRNSDFEQNGGVVCDYEWNSLILRNSSGSVSLLDDNDNVVSHVDYLGSQVVSGKSLYNDGGELHLETVRQYGQGDYGTPGNRTQIRVSSHLDRNHNGYPDWSRGNPRLANHGLRIYDTDWQALPIGENQTNEIESTSQPYRRSAMFVVDANDFIVCSVEVPGYSQSFARTITGFLSYPAINVTENSSESTDENQDCITVSMEEGQITSLLFGQAKQDQEPETEIRVHAVIDENGTGQPEAGAKRQSGWETRLYNTDNSSWQFVDSIETTGKSYWGSARLFVTSGNYALCGVVPSGYEYSFAVTNIGWVYASNETNNLSGQADETDKCMPIEAGGWAINSHVFGYKPAQ